jgi:hypothetical protein
MSTPSDTINTETSQVPLPAAKSAIRAEASGGVVADPRDRRVVGAERRARQQQAEARARERVDVAAAPGGLLAHVVRLVGDQQRRRLGAAAPVDRGARGDGLVGDGDAVAVARLAPGGVGPVGLEVEPVARGVGRPLARDVGGRRDDRDAGDAPLGQHPVGDVQPERCLAGGRGRRGEEGVGGVGEDGGGRDLLPLAQRSVGRPGRQGQAGGFLSYGGPTSGVAG